MYVYALHMLNERLQILVTAEQRRRLEHEARSRGTSVGSVIREAVEAQIGGVTQADRLEALDAIRALDGALAPPPQGDPQDGRADAVLAHLAP
jgi:hypothetical protein